jgi:hypothetical protein
MGRVDACLRFEPLHVSRQASKWPAAVRVVEAHNTSGTWWLCGGAPGPIRSVGMSEKRAAASAVSVAVDDVATVCRAVIDGELPVPVEVASLTAKLVSQAYCQGGAEARFSDNREVAAVLAFVGRASELRGRLGRPDLVTELDQIAAATIKSGKSVLMMTMTLPLLRSARAVLVRARG